MSINGGEEVSLCSSIEVSKILPKPDGVDSEDVVKVGEGTVVPGKTIHISFLSVNQDVDYACECSENQRFSDVESKFFEAYPNYRTSGVYFLCQGDMIRRRGTLKENGVSDGSVIMVAVCDDDLEKDEMNSSQVRLCIRMFTRDNPLLSLKAMFSRCENIKAIEFCNRDVIRGVVDMSYMFYGCSSLVCLPEILVWNVGKVSNVSHMCDLCGSLDKRSRENLASFLERIKVAKGDEVDEWSGSKYAEIVEVFDLKKLKNVSRVKIFGKNFVERYKGYIKISINGKELMDLCTYVSVGTIKNGKVKISIYTRGGGAVVSLKGMFIECRYIGAIFGLSGMSTRKVIDMSHMFQGCENLTHLSDTCKWDTSNVTNMKAMFFRCYRLRSVRNVHTWDTRKVDNMERMFYDCRSLGTFGVSKLGNEKTIKKEIFKIDKDKDKD